MTQTPPTPCHTCPPPWPIKLYFESPFHATTVHTGSTYRDHPILSQDSTDKTHHQNLISCSRQLITPFKRDILGCLYELSNMATSHILCPSLDWSVISLLTCLYRILEALGWVRMHEAVRMPLRLKWGKWTSGTGPIPNWA